MCCNIYSKWCGYKQTSFIIYMFSFWSGPWSKWVKQSNSGEMQRVLQLSPAPRSDQFVIHVTFNFSCMLCCLLMVQMRILLFRPSLIRDGFLTGLRSWETLNDHWVPPSDVLAISIAFRHAFLPPGAVHVSLWSPDSAYKFSHCLSDIDVSCPECFTVSCEP